LVTAPPVPEVLRRAVAAIPDPEVPVLTIEDLGVLRAIDRVDGRVVVTITPTYSGCPAMHHIEQEVARVLAEAGVDGEVRTVLSPAWSTDWMSEPGRRKLNDYGIAPPRQHASSQPPHPTGGVPVELRPPERRPASPVPCPRCGSVATEVVSEFGSTACKALYRCLACLEPFDYFKEL
jgi:ring-1,2-phenylacetyl-CoA epoxidase subunit PaaD